MSTSDLSRPGAAAQVEVPNPQRPSAFQRWLAAGTVGALTGVPATTALPPRTMDRHDSTAPL